MNEISQHQFERWSRQFGELDLQIHRLSLACDINLANTGMVDSVIANTTAHCGKKKPRVFTTLRGLLVLRFLLQAKAKAELGSHSALMLARYNLDRMRERAGRRP